jgi:hypothetical protein
MAGDRQPINQPSIAPTTKVTAGGVAGALTVLVVWILGLLHVAVPQLELSPPTTDATQQQMHEETREKR